MADYNRVKIGDVFLTDDGLITGMPCRCEVAGVDRLKLTKTGTVRLAADGTPYPYTMPNLGKGSPLQIRPFMITKAVFDDVVDEINDALDANATINITLEGDTGDFDLECYPTVPNGVEFPGTFSDERIDGVTFNFVIAEVN